MEATNYEKPLGHHLDTLHFVHEDVATEHGTFTGIKPLRSKGQDDFQIFLANSASSVRPDDAPGSSKRNGIRFPRHSVKILRDWLDTHKENPYPTEEQKVELELQTQLTPVQIANWLANARRRRKVSERTMPKHWRSPSLQASTPAIDIPSNNAAGKPWDELNPLERWKHSPPENEPARMGDIVNAIVNSDFPDDQSTSPSSYGRRRRGKGSSNGSSVSQLRAPSTASHETVSARTSSLSASSSAQTHGSAQSRSTYGSFGSFSSSLAGKKDRRRKRRAPAVSAVALDDKAKRIFQCTFCTDTFKSKYDWTRHEKSLHLSLEKWICAPQGPIITDAATGETRCAYCDEENPSPAHLDVHNHQACADKGLDSRTFYRKDHLRQHLRLMHHGCELRAPHEQWKSSAAGSINSRCGFCAQRFSTWQERVDHLTAHFKAGARMLQWKGCRGFDPQVAAQVTNAMPPYLIGMEAVSPIPFSASKRAANSYFAHTTQELEHAGAEVRGSGRSSETSEDPNMRQTCPHGGFGGNAGTNCWEVLTIGLAKYTKKMAAQGVVMTDEMLQSQARRIVYDSDDTWNQTAADNPEWLDLFKKASGLDFVPTEIGGSGLQIPEDLETYGDLGLRIPFAVQLQAYNQQLNGSGPGFVDSNNGSNEVDAVPEPYKRALELRRSDLRDVYEQLMAADALYEGPQKCQHARCERNHIDVTLVDDIHAPGPRMRRWCNELFTPAQIASFAQKLGRGSNKAHLPSAAASPQAASSSLHSLEQILDASSASPMGGNPAAYAASQARARSLAALSREEAAEIDTCDVPNKVRRTHMPRHRLQLSPERAQHFATVTEAWQESGMIPPPISTAQMAGIVPATSTATNTTTGAMMEFLGGNIGGSLAFSNDALSTAIPLPATMMTTNDQIHGLSYLPAEEGGLTDEAFNLELHNFTQAQIDPALMSDSAAVLPMDSTDFWTSMSAVPPAPTATAIDAQAKEMNDVDMTDINFDDLVFDGVFDQPMDELDAADIFDFEGGAL